MLYAVYEACQNTLANWFYSDRPNELALGVFGLVLASEYFTMVYVRSAASITMVPKLVLLYFASFHFVLYSRPRPYNTLNLVAASVATLHALLFAVLKFEIPALARGDVNSAKPRAAFTTLPWPALDAMLPPTWTLFMPLSLLTDDHTLIPPPANDDAARPNDEVELQEPVLEEELEEEHNPLVDDAQPTQQETEDLEQPTPTTPRVDSQLLN